MKKRLLILLALAILLAGGYFAWQKQQLVFTPTPVVTEPVIVEQKVNPTLTGEPIDTSDWKTYRNEEYGFKFKYPGEWELKTFMTGGVGLPVDCQQTPVSCRNFAVGVTDKSVAVPKHSFVLEVDNDSFNEKSQMIENEEGTAEDTWTTWEKSVNDREIVKNSIYFPIFGSCWVTANVIPYVPTNKGKDYHFYTLYEVPGNLYENQVEEYCSKEVPDPIFDSVVVSFSIL